MTGSTIATITIREYKSLLLVKAKKDVRYYLNGLHINLADRRVEATNGHRMLRISNVQVQGDDTNKYIINPTHYGNEVKPPRQTLLVRFNFNNGSSPSIDFINDKEQILMTIAPELVDSVFPDTDRVIPIPDNQVEFKEITLNPAYIADIAKIYEPKFPVSTIKFYADKFTVNFSENILLVVMPVRT